MSTTTHYVAAPPPSPPRPRTSRWLVASVAVLVVLAVAGIAVAVTFAVRVAESLSQETTTETVPDVRELVVESDEGTVSLRPGDGTDVEVRTTRVWSSNSHPTLDRRLDAGVLTLSSSCPWITLGCEVNREIVVPAGTTVRVRTVDGPVEADRLVTPSFDVSTVDGRVTASFAQPPEHVSIRSVDGSVRLTLPPASYRVEATTVDGHARVDVPDDPSATREISVSTVDGRVDVLRG